MQEKIKQKIVTFSDLYAWKEGHKLVISIYKETKKFPKAVAPLFISDPFKKKISGLFSTHPPIEIRIEKLSRM